MTPEWLDSWWRAYGQGRQFLGLVFLDACQQVAGLAPLFLEHKFFFPLRLNVLRMVGAGSDDSDALDFVIRPGEESMAADSFLDWLAQENRWDVCFLETLPQTSAAGRLAERLDQRDWALFSGTSPNFVIELPHTWEEYLRGLEAGFRPSLTKFPRRLESRYQVRIYRCERRKDLASCLEALFDLHQMRWTKRGEPGAFSDLRRREFYFRMAQQFLRRGWLEFWLLSLDDTVVAAQLGFRYGETMYSLQEGFHLKYRKDQIGYAVRARVLQEVIRSGAKRYDFLGGDDPYKLKFGARQGNYVTLRFAGPSLLGRMYLAQWQRAKRARRWLRDFLPPPLVAALKAQRNGRVTKSLTGQSGKERRSMSAMHEIAVAQPMIKPAEQIRRLGQTMGFWRHGFDFSRFCGQVFRDFNFHGKTMLEIGCGKGVLCLWAALHGAQQVIGLEPLAEGAYDSRACHRDFQMMADQLGLGQARILPATLQEFEAADNSFDIVLSVASINHLDEKSCIRLLESRLAVEAYEKIFRRVARMMKPGGTLIVMDGGRRNLLGDLGFRNPLSPNIQWFKHQQPEVWAAILENCGFGQASIRWASGRLLRHLRIITLPKSLAYFGQSIFRLEMVRVR